MIEILNLNWQELDAALADVNLRARRLAPVFRDLRRPLRGDQRDHAKSQEGPSGSWPARSPATEARRRARNRGLRVTKAMRTIAPKQFAKRSTPKAILGRLPGAVAYTVGALFLRGTSRVAWSMAHQKGLRVGRGVKLKARPFLWLSSKILETARVTIGDFVIKGWKR